MLRLHPDKRAKASELIHHNWLDGVVVQGEIDVIRRAEEEEAVRKAVAAAGSGAGARRMEKRLSSVSALAQSDADAMKPVDDILIGSGERDASPSQHSGGSAAAAHQPLRLGAAPPPLPSSAGAKENNAGRGEGGGIPQPVSSQQHKGAGTRGKQASGSGGSKRR